MYIAAEGTAKRLGGKFATQPFLAVALCLCVANDMAEAMNATEVLQALVQRGALIQDAENNGLLLLPIHAEFITPAPNQDPPAKGWLYWVDAGAEDQHHAHFRSYATVEIVHERDLKLTDASDGVVAYVAPIAEWPLMDVQALHERLDSARQEVARTPETQEAFNDFVVGCCPRPADAMAAAYLDH